MLSIVLDPDDTEKKNIQVFVHMEFIYILREEEVVQ